MKRLPVFLFVLLALSAALVAVLLLREVDPPHSDSAIGGHGASPAEAGLGRSGSAASIRDAGDASREAPGEEEIRRLILRGEADGYRIRRSGGSLTASNGRHGLSAQWSETGRVQLESLDPTEAWHLRMHFGGVVESVTNADEKLTFDRGLIEEWFINDVRGIEHGFDVASRPAGDSGTGLRVAMEIETSLAPERDDSGRAVRFLGADGEMVLEYGGLVVFDASGRTLPASIEVAPGAGLGTWEMAIHVDDEDARYPLVIDPVFTTPTSSLLTLPLEGGTLFGHAVSISGNAMAVGVPLADGPNPGETDIGAVDVFLYNKTLRVWQRQKRIFPGSPNGVSGFGKAVDLAAGMLIVGAPDDEAAGPASGAAYVFERDAGGANNWGEVAKLVPPDGAPNAFFGASVGIDGGLAAIGAPGHPTPAFNSGAVYAVYRDPAGGWSAPEALSGYVAASEDRYGQRVAVSGARIAAAAVLGQTNASPVDAGIVALHDLELGPDGLPVGQTTTILTDPNPTSGALFGAGLDLEGDELVVGSPNKTTNAGAGAGTVESYRRDSVAGWQWVGDARAPDAKANDRFGSTVSLSGDTLAVGAPFRNERTFIDSGGVYVYERSGASLPGTWGFVEVILRVEKESHSQFGSALSLGGDHLAMGAPYDDSFVVGPDTGVVQMQIRRAAAWVVQHAPLPSNQGGIRSGTSVAIDRGRAAIGMPEHAGGGIVHGAVSILRANHGGEEVWGTEALLESPSGQAGERFGSSVAIAGSWLLVGAPGYDAGGAEDTGRAYLFRQTAATGWTLLKALDLPGLPAGSEFGTAVALTERWAFVGAPGIDHGFVFDRHEGGTDVWDLSTFFNESAEGGRFGSAVTVDGNVAAFSAPRRAGVAPPGEAPATIPGAGQVKLYEAVSVAGDTVWQSMKTLPEPNPDGSFGAHNASFGVGLALKNGLLLVGEPGYLSGTGRVRAFGINTGGVGQWGERQELAAPEAAPGGAFGASVGAGARWLFVGAPGTIVGGLATGAVHTYDRNGLDDPFQLPTSVLLHPRSREGDAFGAALAVSDNELVVGLPGATNPAGIADTGSHVVFHRQSSGWSQLGGPQGALAATGDRLGTSVAVDGEFLVAGAPFDNVNGSAAAGSVHLYRRNPGAASGWSHWKLLFAGDVQVGAEFGAAVDIHGDTIVVGAPGWDNRGAVYVFHQNEGGADQWGQRRRIDLPGVVNGDDFGASVAVRDDILAVGAPRNDLPAVAVDAGIVHVFGRHEGGTSNWGHLDEFREPMPAAFDFFGAAVDVSDGRIMVGAPLADDDGDASGNAYVYGRIGGVTEWVLLESLAIISGESNDRLGGSVAIDGSLCVAGGIGEDTHAAGSGAAWVLRDIAGDGTNWIHQRMITVGDIENPVIHANLAFGSSVSIKGDQIAVGARGYDEGALVNVGAAYVFEQNQTHGFEWGFVRRLTAPEAGSTARFGSAVAIIDDLVVVGAPEADQGAQTDAGHFFLYGDIRSAYEDWARSHFGDAAVDDESLQATVWGALADFDGDELSNACEAFMALDPTTPDPSTASFGTLVDDTDGLAFRYRMGKETGGVLGRVKWSRDLVEWRGGEAPDLDGIAIATRVIEEFADHYIMEARIAAAQIAGEEHLFLRLELHVP